MNRISNALQFVPAQERDVWVAMAMAVKSELGDSGFEIWYCWSQTASNYDARAARAVWKSCKGAGITAATLFHEARLNGFVDDAAFRPPSPAQIQAQRRAAAERATKDGQERIKAALAAAKKARWIMDQCRPEEHAYLQAKGFPALRGLVWRPEQETNLLCIPMSIGQELVGVQMIDKTGAKKFLSGQTTSKAEFCLSAGILNAADYWIEGYASALSLRACLSALKLNYRIHVCFSAGNLKRMAHSGFVIADNDASGTGQEAARATGLPYWIPEVVGTDINDVHKAQGTFKTSQMLRKWLLQERRATATE